MRLIIRSRKPKGFTLIELMVTLAVSLILLSVGFPAYQELSANSRMTTVTNSFVAYLQFARNEAVERNRPVSLCPSGDGRSCQESSAWGDGWIVFTDAGNAGALDSSDELLRAYKPEDNDITLAANKEYIRYLPDGSVDL